MSNCQCEDCLARRGESKPATSDDIHSCSYYCDRPECIKAQRDELRDKLFSAQPLTSDEVKLPPLPHWYGPELEQQAVHLFASKYARAAILADRKDQAKVQK